MKRMRLLVGTLLCMVLAAGCQLKAEPTSYETYLDVYSAEYFLKNNPEYLEDEVMIQDAMAAAVDENKELLEKIRAVELLCEIEYLKASEDEKIARDSYTYPVYGELAAGLFGEINNVGSEDFWSAMKESSARQELLYAAAPYMSTETLLKVYQDRDIMDDYLEMSLHDGIAHSLRSNPSSLYASLETMYENGYFDEGKDYIALKILQDGTDALGNLEESLTYLEFVSATAWPLYQSYFPDELSSWLTSDLREDKDYLTPRLNIELSQDRIDLSHLDKTGVAEAVAIPAGRILALACNGDLERYPEAGSDYLICGDFMLNLPEDRRPLAAEDIDYVFLFSTTYEVVGEYVPTGSTEQLDEPIYAMEGTTSMDLYNWVTGELVGSYGTVVEDSPSMIMVSNRNKDGKRYTFAKFPGARELHRQISEYFD